MLLTVEILFGLIYQHFVLHGCSQGHAPLVTVGRWLQQLLFIRLVNEAGGTLSDWVQTPVLDFTRQFGSDEATLSVSTVAVRRQISAGIFLDFLSKCQTSARQSWFQLKARLFQGNVALWNLFSVSATVPFTVSTAVKCKWHTFNNEFRGFFCLMASTT